MIGYTHLTREERYQIFALKRAGHSQATMAAIIGRSPSTAGPAYSLVSSIAPADPKVKQ